MLVALDPAAGAYKPTCLEMTSDRRFSASIDGLLETFRDGVSDLRQERKCKYRRDLSLEPVFHAEPRWPLILLSVRYAPDYADTRLFQVERASKACSQNEAEVLQPVFHRGAADLELVGEHSDSCRFRQVDIVRVLVYVLI